MCVTHFTCVSMHATVCCSFYFKFLNILAHLHFIFYSRFAAAVKPKLREKQKEKHKIRFI